MIILFVSHVHFLRDALVQTWRGDHEVEIFGAACCEGVEATVSKLSPSLILVDPSHADGPALVSAARARSPDIKVVVLASCEQDEELLAWADIGISGYLEPNTATVDLKSAMRRVVAGDVVCPPRLTALLLARCAKPSNDRAGRSGVHVLTCREREIAALLADGMSNKLIARYLSISVSTVKNHVHNILDKWDVKKPGEVAARYRRQVRHNKQDDKALAGWRGSKLSLDRVVGLRNGAIPTGKGPAPDRVVV